MREPSIVSPLAVPLKLPSDRSAGSGRWIPWPPLATAVAAGAFFVGLSLSGLPFTPQGKLDALRGHVLTQEMQIRQLQGELELHRLEKERLGRIVHFSSQFRIAADLAALIYDAAVFEGLDPELGFRLVRVESGFRRDVVSPKGAIGYTQLLPSTARWLDPTVKEEDLFDPETNLHLGFRYLGYLLEEYRGDVRLALLAYNRGPATVSDLIALGRDPANGFARAVCGDTPCSGALEGSLPARPGALRLPAP